LQAGGIPLATGVTLLGDAVAALTLNQLFIEEAMRSLENAALPVPVLVPLKSDQPILELIQSKL
jgi:hypothetical protein